LHIATNFTIKKNERLKSHKLIEHLFSKGKSFSVFPVKALFDFTDLHSDVPLQAGVAVSKKNFKKAVDRNRIKRLLREAYRLQKNELQLKLEGDNKQLAIFFIYTGKELPVINDLKDKIKVILLHLQSVLEID
jgi:ribonuclease P protein component